MTLSDPQIYRNILGSIMKKPETLIEYSDIIATDFDIKIFQGIFLVLTDLQKHGYDLPFTELSFDMEFHRCAPPTLIELYDSQNGLQIVADCLMVAEPENFEYYYSILKKNALLRSLKKKGYNIKNFYVDSKEGFVKDEKKIIQNYNEATVETILGYYDADLNDIRSTFLTGTRSQELAGEGLDNLMRELENNEVSGPQVEGDIFSFCLRGARKGCLFVKSASSGSGKTRSAVFDACKLVYPVVYDLQKQTYIQQYTEENKLRKPNKLLFIVTEMDKDEIQTIILAYLSKVNEEHILNNKYDAAVNEKERVFAAKKIMEIYKDYFIIKTISEPTTENVSAVIKKFATIDKVKYVCFDYIHSTSSMMSQFASTGLNEASVLMLMSNQLKQLAKDYHICIFSATQVNQQGMERTLDFKDEQCIRGSKAVADKVDCGYCMTVVTPEMCKELAPKIGGMPEKPTHVLDIYKMRRGRYKDIRIWVYLNLGTGERRDLFVTTRDNELLPELSCGLKGSFKANDDFVKYDYLKWKEELLGGK